MNQKEIDELAIQWNGINRTERWRLSISSCNKTDDGKYVFIGKRTRFV